jgi:dolichyl-phosphate beta-glucosyltransferase
VTPRLSVVVPAFNEAGRIGHTLERLDAFSRSLSAAVEIVLVDDGSGDDTAAVVERAALPNLRLIRLPQNVGKGGALRAGVAATAGAEVLISDADLSAPIEEYHRLRPHLDEADLVLGSRALAESRITRRQPWHREAMGKTFNWLVRSLVIGGFHDTQCGFKLLRGEIARELFSAMKIDRFAFDVELVWLAVRRGYTVREIGVAWHDSPQSRVHPLRDSSRMLADILRIRFLHRAERRAGRGAARRGATEKERHRENSEVLR